MRNCNDCGLHPELAAAGKTTGAKCELKVATMAEGQSFEYNLKMTNPKAETTFDTLGNGDLVTYYGTEWAVFVTDVSTPNNSPFLLGRVLLEDDEPTQGIEVYKSFHEHIGCTACDAFYERTTVTGPFINAPAGVQILSGKTESIPSKYTCTRHREFSLGGLAISLETGPGLSGGSHQGTSLFTCGGGSRFSEVESENYAGESGDSDDDGDDDDADEDDDNSFFE